MDADTAKLVLSLQLEHLESIINATEDPKAPAAKSDSTTALIAYRDEVASKLSLVRDGRLGRSIALAVQRDGGSIRVARHQENIAIFDRNAAFLLNGTPGPNLPSPVIDLTDDAPHYVMGRLSAINSTLPEVIDSTPPPQLKLGQKLHLMHRQQNEEDIIGVRELCAACQEPVAYFAAVYAPCGHDYCKDCIR